MGGSGVMCTIAQHRLRKPEALFSGNNLKQNSETVGGKLNLGQVQSARLLVLIIEQCHGLSPYTPHPPFASRVHPAADPLSY